METTRLFKSLIAAIDKSDFTKAKELVLKLQTEINKKQQEFLTKRIKPIS